MTGLFIGPRRSARTKRKQAAYDSRDMFQNDILDLWALCINLGDFVMPPGVTYPMRSRVQGECDRWISQIDEITANITDHWQRFALTYSTYMGVSNIAIDYARDVRWIWLSNRPLADKVSLIKERTEPIQAMYFTRRWHVISIVQAINHLLKMREDAQSSSVQGPQAG
jgi:hypothetical protein